MKKNTSVQTTTTNTIKGKGLKAKAKARIAKPDVGKPEAAKPVAKDTSDEKKSGVNIGRSTGMRVMAYQDHTFAINDRADRRLTNEELASDWRKEFPNSRAVLAGRITAEMVQAVRNLYNNGTGGHGTPGTKHESRPYSLQDGKRVAGEVASRTRSAAPQPAAQPAATKAKGGKVAAEPVAEKRAVAKVVVKGKKKAA